MKKLSSFLPAVLLLCLAMPGYAQSCCKKPSGNDMKALALNKSFRAAHEAPLPFSFTPEQGSMLEFKVPGGDNGQAFYVPANEPTDKVLIVVHEWWGLNDYIKREAERWQKLLGGKVAVYAVDLYDGKVAAQPDEAGKLMGGLTPGRAGSILTGLIEKIGKNKSIATLGWCMGGSWSFAATLAAGSQSAGCVMYYGFPEKDVKKIKTLKSDVLYIYGSKDTYIKPEDVSTFGKVVEASGHKFSLHTYDAVHAFANPSNPHFDAKSADEAQVFTLKFLREKLSIE